MITNIDKQKDPETPIFFQEEKEPQGTKENLLQCEICGIVLDNIELYHVGCNAQDGTSQQHQKIHFVVSARCPVCKSTFLAHIKK